MKRIVVLCALLTLAAAAPALAIDAQNVNPAFGPQNLLSLYTSTTLNHGQFALGLVGNHASRPVWLELDRSGDDLGVVDSLTTGNFYATVGLWRRLDLMAGASYYTVSGADMDAVAIDGLPETTDTAGNTMGDTLAGLKLTILRNEPGSVGLGLNLLVGIATGDPDLYAGNGATTFSGALLLDKSIDRVNIVANAGYRYLGGPEDLEPAAQFHGGIGLDVAAARWVGFTGELVGKTLDYGIDAIDPATPLEGLLGVRFYTKAGVNFTLAGGAGITDAIGSPVYRAMAGISFAYPALFYGPPTPKPTAVGPIDSKDADFDRDGLNNWAERHEYKTDPANPDTDGDGLTDGEEVMTTHTDPLNADTDGDSLSDATEVRMYATDPNKVDTDGDGLSDGQEINQLRTNPLAADSDGDGVPDGVDGAPLEPETVNGFMDEDGVPEVLLARKANGVMMFENQVFLPGSLTFGGEQGSTLTADDQKLLAGVVDMLKDFPEVEVQVEGHVAAGTPDAEALSGKRAEAVRDYLVRSGIDEKRLTAVGMGSEVPITTNDTPEGRARNTRIDFVITAR